MSDDQTAAAHLMAASDMLTQMFEFGAGQRRKLREDNWSEEAAEMIAVNIINHLVDKAFAS